MIYLSDLSEHPSFSDLSHSTHPTVDTADGLVVRFGGHDTTGTTDTPVDRTTDSLAISDRYNRLRMEPILTSPLLENSHSAGDDHVEDEVLHISGAGYWILDGWMGDHAVEFLVDSGSSGDRYVTLFISIAGSCRGTGGDIRVHHTDITRCQWDWYCGGRMLSLCGFIHGIAGGIPYSGL